jgi:hypothetical protein
VLSSRSGLGERPRGGLALASLLAMTPKGWVDTPMIFVL